MRIPQLHDRRNALSRSERPRHGGGHRQRYEIPELSHDRLLYALRAGHGKEALRHRHPTLPSHRTALRQHGGGHPRGAAPLPRGGAQQHGLPAGECRVERDAGTNAQGNVGTQSVHQRGKGGSPFPAPACPDTEEMRGTARLCVVEQWESVGPLRGSL